ncbi:PAS domain S-box protein [Bacteroidota bacterium]
MIYILIVLAGITVIFILGYRIYSGIGTNQINTSLINTSLDIKYHVTAIYLKLDESSGNFGIRLPKEYLHNLDSVAQRISLTLNNEKLESAYQFPLIDDIIRKEFVGLKKMLIEYKELAIRKSELRKINISDAGLNNEFLFLYEKILNTSKNVKEKLDQVVLADLEDFKTTHFILIVVSSLFLIFVIIIFSRLEYYRARTMKTVREKESVLEEALREHNLAEEALLESENRLSRLIGNLPGTVYRCKNDEKRTMQFISEGCQLITGYKSAELTNNERTPYSHIIHHEDLMNVKKQINAALEKKKPFQLVYRIFTAHGYEKWVWEQGVGIFSDKGIVLAIEGFIIDITEQRTAESQLTLLSTALETAANGIMITDVKGNIVWINGTFTKMTGYTAKDILGKNASMLKSGRHNQSYYNELWDTISSGEVWRGELINKRKNGSFYDEEITISPVKDVTGQISHYIGIKDDISERKQADIALRESEERFRGLYENATIGIYQTNTEGKVLMANQRMVDMLGFKSFEALHFVDFEKRYVSPDERKAFKEIIERKGVVTGFESAWRRTDRSIIYLRESARAIRNERGKIKFYEGTLEDITDRKRAEYALIEAKERAEKSDQLKTEFLAQMSHEVRTPINAVLSFSNMIREEVEEQVDDELKEGFKIIDIEGKRVIRTVDLILNMSQLQTDTYAPIIQMVDVCNDVVTGSYDEYKPMAEEKGLEFTIMKKTDNTFAMVDEYSIKQIVNNLFDNAIKYTQRGKVEVIVERDEEKRMLIHVKDTGIGISKEYQKILFTPFTQEEQGYSRKFDGNGLGLALIKKYCELNDAEIKVESKKGKGSTFTLIFAPQPSLGTERKNSP